MEERKMILPDANIIIELLKGNNEILSEIEKIGANDVILSKITILEMYVGALNRNDLIKFKDIWQNFRN